MTIGKHIPSHTTIAGYRVLTSYEGRPLTCYDYGATGHMYQACPKKRGKGRVSTTRNTTTYALIAAHGTPPRPEGIENRTEGTAHTKQVSQSEDPMEETSELTQTERQLRSECTTDSQTEQNRAMTI